MAKRRKEKAKKGQIVLLGFTHRTKKDLQQANLKEHLKDAQILYHENPRVLPQLRSEMIMDQLRKVKDGKISLEQSIFIGPGLLRTEAEILQGRKKLRLEFEPFIKRLEQQVIEEEGVEAYHNFVRGKFEEAIKKVRKHADFLQELSKEREKIMIEDLSKLSKKNPDKKILGLFGAAHLSIAKELKRKGYPVKLKLQSGHVTFGFLDEYLRSKIYGKKLNEEKIKELMAKELLSGIIKDYLLAKKEISAEDATLKIRRVCDRIKTNEIKELSENLGHLYSRFQPTKQETTNIVLEWLEKKRKITPGEL